jgi:hypothetical protein
MLSGVNPFKLRNKNRNEKLQMILENKIIMFPIFSEIAKDLLQKLLVTDVSVSNKIK